MNLLLSLSQLIGGIVLTFGNVPQIIQIIKTRSVEDINLKAHLNILLGCSLMEIYAVGWVYNGGGQMFLFTNTLSVILALVMVALIKKYKRKTEEN